MKKVILSFSFALIAFAGFSQASNSKNHNVTLALHDVADIKFSGTPDGDFDFDTGDKYEAGIEKTAAATIQVRSNRNWKVDIETSTANFTWADNGGFAEDGKATMPSTVLKAKVSGGSFASLSTTSFEIKTGSRGGYGSNEFSVDYKADPKYAYAAGDYTINVLYTVTQE